MDRVEKVAHMTRDEALEAAICGKRTHCELEFMAATAGADAELARVVEWLRAEQDGALVLRHKRAASALRYAADALAARAHWGDDA